MKKIITGNWKMNKTISQAVQFIELIKNKIEDTERSVYLAVPFTAIKDSVQAANGSRVVIGAQNMHDASEGAFTGEIAGLMLKEAGAKFVLLGHSERRIYFHESDSFINKKLKKSLEIGLQPTLCIGENLDEKERGETESVLKRQLEGAFEGIHEINPEQIVLAYEPVWAIGTGLTASAEEVEATHLFCRNWFEEKFTTSFASNIVIQYGGSVKPENAKELLEQPNVGGLLVGGASLSPEQFLQIIHA